MIGTVGDGTLDQVGGPPELRGAATLAESEKSFAERARDVFTDYSSTVSPLYSLAPNLGDSIPLKDSAGVNFTVIPARDQNGEINYIEIVNGGQGEEGALIYYTIAENPIDTRFIDEQIGAKLKEEEALEAGKEKLEELLAPIKAAQAAAQAVPHAPGETLNPRPAAGVVFQPGMPEPI